MLATSQLRPLGAGEILDRVFRLYRNNFARLVGIPLAVLVPLAVLQLTVVLISGRLPEWIGAVQTGFLDRLIDGALVLAFSGAYLTQTPGVREAYQAAGKRYLSLWGAGFLTGLILILPLALLGCVLTMIFQGFASPLIAVVGVPVAVVVIVRLLLAVPCILLEGVGAKDSLSRSWALTRGYFWKVAGTSFLGSLLVWAIGTVPSLALTYGLLYFMPDATFGPLAQIALSHAGLILTMPISAGLSVVLYYDLRVRQEGFDLEWQARQAAAPAANLA